jgi:hypothetical protein
MPNDKIVQIDQRLKRLEQETQQPNEEPNYLITVCEEQWIFGPDDVPVPVHREPIAYTEPTAGGFGSPKIFVRRAIYGDDAGRPVASAFDLPEGEVSGD